MEERWDLYGEDIHQEVKQNLMQLMLQGTLPLGEEYVFIRNKIGTIVAEVAIRTW